MDINQIRKLMRLIQSSDITEIEVTEGDQTVRISRKGAAPDVQHYMMPQPQHFSAPAAPAPAASPAPAAPIAADEPLHVVSSPMVGTFYRASSPDAAPFVSEGSKVKKGDTLCVIEAMKLMNEIEAEYAGIVEKIMVENATPLEYGQPMFVITPTA
ncbi:MAG: acetyl-CoA carboxylase, biotin carboxyl carrier protein [Zetaproteobacteria bacterium CG12_big_fil_rev_8_21_14_0_65_55_1124]|nr:MAG: acetyl-CoA carboxylase, biotin carboxyl carrier protein [Zetaproteobacteria bacterium CG1_02_55_237]PIS19536.1 MAG: acetyl-CoA carboxylase, biotin carboxyl carrier protein [Zetaproteobacteria bacterium CG08_land_8_20_14_0_20_55_17]PIW42363.1 MAG: acetyl-CoA carboxylase, biotin carboxyl carrier protein [Zetaproteobacteria bacterium CG12_big_fil_rev_8_21_14_0_65_55_1124]PIY52836.1 MAG: acetyl-CoA carboxylase, biotin carboxyl carrier protein [Zetaproteobacteria bacterium CG_4_10_14_0_8_um_f